ncbi:MAG: hypothetical protein P9M07_06255 [Candidatus Aceula meridiana]|nr:hypothetical protein [Candidatus Aceula meridiana]
MLIHDKGNKRIESQLSEERTKLPVIIHGNILFENIPLKNAVIEFNYEGTHGQTLYRIGKTYTGLNGHFYAQEKISQNAIAKQIGARICIYSTPGPNAKPFPIFFGSKNFAFVPEQRDYNLLDINLHLGLCFCERPLVFKGQIISRHDNEFLFTQQTVRLFKQNGTILSETPVDIDGSYCIYTYGDGIIGMREELIIEVSTGHRAAIDNVFVEPSSHVYQKNIKFD